MSPLIDLIGSAKGYGWGALTAGSSFESIATVVGSDQSQIIFSSIPSTYKHLQIRGGGRNTGSSSSTDNFYMRFNDDSGNNYTTHWMEADGANATGSNVSPWTLQLFGQMPATTATANIFGATIADIQDYSSSSKNTTVRYFTGNDRNGSGQIFAGSSSWMNTSAISKITILCSNNFAVGSVFSLYGIKG
jgi:hypothetical protein